MKIHFRKILEAGRSVLFTDTEPGDLIINVIKLDYGDDDYE